MSKRERILSTSDQRREAVIESAVSMFAKTGYYGTTVADVAQAAGISPAYVFRLFPTKVELFVAAIRRCYDSIENALLAIPPASATRSSVAVLEEIGGMYAQLIGDSTLIQLQIQAQSVASIPAIQEAVQQGLQRFTEEILQRSGATPEAVQRLVAYGQLCHLIVVAGLHKIDEPWAKALTSGMVHPQA